MQLVGHFPTELQPSTQKHKWRRQGSILGFDGNNDGQSNKKEKDKERGWKGMGVLWWVLLALETKRG